MKGLLRISIGLNLALAICVAWTWLGTKDSASSTALESAQGVAVPRVDSGGNSPPAPTLLFVTNAFRWSALESTNWDELITNLRAVECPERTIRDILLADAESRYANAETASLERLPFWLAGRARAEASRRMETNCSAAQSAVVADVKRLFGIEWSPDEPETHTVQVQALTRLLAGPVPDEVHERAIQWIMLSVRLGQRFREERDGVTLQADQIRWQEIVTGRQTQLQRLFGDAAYDELLARSTAMEELLESRNIHLRYQELTPTEMRQVSLTKARAIGWLPDLFSGGASLRLNEDEQKAKLAEAIKEVLPPERYAEFVRVQDENYRDILDVTLEAHLPRSTAQKIYDLRTLAEAEYQRLSAAPHEPGNAAALQEIQETTTAALRQLMGPDAFNAYTTRNGQWVTNLHKL